MAEAKQYTVQGDEKDFFDGVGEKGAPSFKFTGEGSGVKGKIVDQYRTFATDLKGNVKTYEKSGEPIPQLNVTLQTTLRNWKGVKVVPTDDDGNALDPSEDTGLRRVYVKYDMRRAVAVAVKGEGERYMVNGGELAIKQTGEKDVGQANGLPLFEARYKAPAGSDDGFVDETPDEPAAKTPAPAAARPAAPEQDDEPPF